MSRRLVYKTFHLKDGLLLPVTDKYYDYGHYNSPEEAQENIRQADFSFEEQDVIIMLVSVPE